MLKEHAVMGYHLHRLSMLIGMLQDLVARHDAALHFIQDHLPTEFDQRAPFVAQNRAWRLK